MPMRRLDRPPPDNPCARAVPFDYFRAIDHLLPNRRFSLLCHHVVLLLRSDGSKHIRPFSENRSAAVFGDSASLFMARPSRFQAGTPSTTEMSPDVGMTRVSRKPWAAKSRRYSASVRSRPPSRTIMCRSSNLPNDAPLPCGKTARRRSSLRPGRHRAAEVIEDESGLGVVPVVDDVAEQVGVGAARGRLEEVAAFDLAAARDAGRLQPRAGPLDNVRQVEQKAPHRRVAAEGGGQVRCRCRRRCRPGSPTPERS